jgi:hypothetical protein
VCSISVLPDSWSREQNLLYAPFQGYLTAGAESRMCIVCSISGLLDSWSREQNVLCALFRGFKVE